MAFPKTIEEAQAHTVDPQATQRGYLTEKVLADAQALAAEKKRLALDFPSASLSVGSPHQWWEKQSSIYSELADSDYYANSKRFACLLDLANI